MPISKRNKSKTQSTSASPTVTDVLAEQPSVPDDDLMNDLFAELDSRDKKLQQGPVKELQDASVDRDEKAVESGSRKQNSKVRHLARQARKAAALAQNFSPSNPDTDAQVNREIKQEAALIKRTCDELAVQIHEINPDGHCLFSAIADQLALLNILPENEANYATVRAAASGYMSRHPDDFLPFLPTMSEEDGVGISEHIGVMDARQFERYCVIVRDTAAWGGEPEILALSRAYNVPIQVIQAGTPSVVTHTPDGNLPDNLSRNAKVVRISFHRRMYGLGEHYNSLRPKNTLASVADKIHLMLS